MDRHPEQKCIDQSLSQNGVRAAFAWAHWSSIQSTLSIYEPEAGHDPTWLGTTRHNQFRDRLDRVFSCGAYRVSADTDSDSGLDVVHASLSAIERRTMPLIPPNTVTRHDANQSPGWLFGDLQFLLQSHKSKGVKKIPWHRLSKTKQDVARRPFTSEQIVVPRQEVLSFESADPVDQYDDVFTTLIIAHGFDPISRIRELAYGRPQFTKNGDAPWHWLELIDEDPRETGNPIPVSPSPDPNAPLDANVRLRKRKEQEKTE